MKVLVLSPHTDDAELGCGGAIAAHADRGDTVRVIAFSTPLPELYDEFDASMKVLGATGRALDFETRFLPDNRQQVLDCIMHEKQTFAPDIVYCPSIYDTHQDHMTVYAEAVRAFHNTTMYGYEVPWNNFRFSTDIFTKLTEKQLRRKIAALTHYKTQQHRYYFDARFLEGLARVRGVQSQTEFAEAFEAIRIIN
jgi:LmbE family N-acetylglucosaminyl deacetylase